ncbi:MAG TPA: hypothetical protein VF017_18260 [Thermoanaerobaculia bacterium]|nr:hypothetical protein [Thermoanaerobaculia bacterium]
MKSEKAAGGTSWALAFGRNVALWLVPCWLLWAGLTSFYNRFLTQSAENLLLLTESPNVTQLLRVDEHYVAVSRTDFPPSKGKLYQIRVTDIHFHLLLLFTLFLAVPGLPWKQKLQALGWAWLAAVFFQIADLFLWVKFVYATQLGTWSGEHYGAFGQNFWGLAKHVFDLPLKLALPFALWMAFFYRELSKR